MAHYRPSTINDCYALAPKMCKQDQREVMASGGHTPLEALLKSFEASYECNSIINDDGDMIGMFGVAKHPLMPELYGIPWLLSDGTIHTIRRDFLTLSKQWIEKVSNRHRILFNYSDCRNSKAHGWLMWLGFKFINKVENFGKGEKPFYLFVRIFTTKQTTTKTKTE